MCNFCFICILCLSQKSAEELCVITLKNDAKFEEELTCSLKNDMRNLVNFTRTLKNLKICTLREFFCPRNITFELKNYRGLCIMTLKGYAIFKEKLTGGFKNDIRNLVNFHASSRKCENVHFDRIVLPKAYKVLDEKVQKSYVS